MTLPSMDEVLGQLTKLPAIPSVVQEVINSLSQDDLDSTVLTHKIGQDSALAARVLRVANSAFYGLTRQVCSIHEAIAVLGFSNVRSLVISAGLVGSFAPVEGGVFDRKKFWSHSARVAALAKCLAKHSRQDQGIAFTAGLMHGIGQLALDVCAHDAFADALQQAATSGRGLIETEQNMLGFDHAMIGAELSKRWNFPNTIVHAIRYHASPDQEPFEPVTGIVQMAWRLVEALDAGTGREAILSDFSETTSMSRIKLDWEEVSACLDAMDQMPAGCMLE